MNFSVLLNSKLNKLCSAAPLEKMNPLYHRIIKTLESGYAVVLSQKWPDSPVTAGLQNDLIRLQSGILLWVFYLTTYE